MKQKEGIALLNHTRSFSTFYINNTELFKITFYIKIHLHFYNKAKKKKGKKKRGYNWYIMMKNDVPRASPA